MSWALSVVWSVPGGMVTPVCPRNRLTCVLEKSKVGLDVRKAEREAAPGMPVAAGGAVVGGGAVGDALAGGAVAAGPVAAGGVLVAGGGVVAAFAPVAAFAAFA